MLFLHAFTGSDYKSSFYGVRKLKWFDVFFKTEKYDETFIRLSGNVLSLSDEDFLKINEFTLEGYGIKGGNTNDLAMHR